MIEKLGHVLGYAFRERGVTGAVVVAVEGGEVEW